MRKQRKRADGERVVVRIVERDRFPWPSSEEPAREITVVRDDRPGPDRYRRQACVHVWSIIR